MDAVYVHFYVYDQNALDSMRQSNSVFYISFEAV